MVQESFTFYLSIYTMVHLHYRWISYHFWTPILFVWFHQNYIKVSLIISKGKNMIEYKENVWIIFRNGHCWSMSSTSSFKSSEVQRKRNDSKSPLLEDAKFYRHRNLQVILLSTYMGILEIFWFFLPLIVIFHSTLTWFRAFQLSPKHLNICLQFD